MRSFVEEHRKILLERIRHDEAILAELKQKDISDWDDFNKDNYNRTIQNLKHNIEWNSETIRIIDEANKATDERKETEKRGEQIRTETQKKTNETIKKINAPNADRDAILDDLLQSRNAAKAGKN